MTVISARGGALGAVILFLAVFRAPGTAQAAVSAACMNICGAAGGTVPECTPRCTVDPVPTGQEESTSDYKDSLAAAQERQKQELEIEKRKLELKQERFRCIEACQAGPEQNTLVHCQQVCDAPAAD